MKVQRVAFGERYGDDSGWSHHLDVDLHDNRVRVDISGSDTGMSVEDAWWLLRALMQAREQLGMDKIVLDGPSPPNTSVEQK